MLQSSTAPLLWVKSGEDMPYVSYDQRLWFYSTWEDLAERRYYVLEAAMPDEVAYNRDGEVVGVATKAVEATPKYIPPIIEEREV